MVVVLALWLALSITTIAPMDRASQALAQDFPADLKKTYAAIADRTEVPLTTLYHRDHGRRSREEHAQSQQYLTPEEEKAMVRFLLRMSGLGHPVRIKFIPSLAFSIARRRSTTSKPIKPPGKNWPRAFEKRHPELKARRVRAIDWKRHENNIHDKIVEWFEVIGKVLQDPAVLAENVYNMDETGVMLSKLGSVKVLVDKDDVRDYRGTGVKRTMVTAIECISADGRSLHPLIIWPASTHRSNWTTYPTPEWHYAHSENGYNDSKISLEWLRRVFDPQTRARANSKPRVLVCDGFGTHETLEVLEFCLENNIIMCRIPSHTSHKIQPCDVGPFAPLKAAYRDQVERLNRGGVDTVGKEHFTSLYKPAREKALSRRNIMAGWSATGLYPYNPKRVLDSLPKSTANSTATETYSLAVSSSQEEIPQTPVTPVSAEALTSLHNRITQDAYAHDAQSRQRLQKHVQKLASAAQISFAERALLQDQNRFLLKVNGEAKTRRSTRSVVLGRAKVMSFQELEEARSKRAAKDRANAEKKTRGRKGKRAAVEEHASSSESADKVLEMSEVLPPRQKPALPWRAPVARMY
jgi:hypothetical protein